MRQLLFCAVLMGVLLTSTFLGGDAHAQCGVTMSCLPSTPGTDPGVITIGGGADNGGLTGSASQPCAGACVLGDQARRQYERQNNCYFADQYCGGTTAAHRFDLSTQCCGVDPKTGKAAVQSKQASAAAKGYSWEDYVKACPNKRQSEGAPDGLWSQCKVGEKHSASDDWAVREVIADSRSPNARQHCVDGCSTPPGVVRALTTKGSFIFEDKDNPTGAGAGGIGDVASFYGACKNHDLCYQSCDNRTQKNCDDQLRQDMLELACNRIPIEHETTYRGNFGRTRTTNTRDKCISAASDMWVGLRAFGEDAFNLRRQQYCQCC